MILIEGRMQVVLRRFHEIAVRPVLVEVSVKGGGPRLDTCDFHNDDCNAAARTPGDRQDGCCGEYRNCQIQNAR
jgi:hypothetical protein